MKFTTLKIFTLLFIIANSLISISTHTSYVVPKHKHTKIFRRVNPPAVSIIDPKGTNLYQFALGAANILVSDPSAASDCQREAWKIDQPTVEKGTEEWFSQMVKPLSQITKLLDVHPLQMVCKKHPARLKGWLHHELKKEKLSYEHDLKHNKPHKNKYSNPYGDQNAALKTKKKGKNFLEAEAKTESKGWLKVLALSIKPVPFYLLQYKMILDKALRGFIFIQFNEFCDCVAKDIDTGRAINDRIVAYRLLMNYAKNGRTMTEFSNVFGLAMCNWKEFVAHVNLLI